MGLSTVESLIKLSILNPYNWIIAAIFFLTTLALIKVYAVYVKKSHSSGTSLVKARILVICALNILFLLCFEFIRVIPTSEFLFIQYVRFFIIGSLIVTCYQYFKKYFKESTFKIIQTVPIVLVLCYMLLQFGRTISYQPWVTKNQMENAYSNVYELNCFANPFYSLVTLRFFREEKNNFINPFGIEMKKELKRDLMNLPWTKVPPSPTKYETLILLKMSKILIEDDYQKL
jgi:hypothetical protein